MEPRKASLMLCLGMNERMNELYSPT